ncbi:MAG: ABC transporter ATP-binding protein [Alphaproteobacteria bacterium]|nr:ABC transporter ATP-binding protein [Alphaproteobacteria bacterium]
MATEPLLETRGLVKKFGGVAAIDMLDFHVEDGEILGVIGPNGSGKTTLFNVITGFLSANGGQVYLRGNRITNLSPHRIARRGIVRTFQLNLLFRSLTVLENIRFGYHLQRENSVFGAFFNTGPTRREERAITEMAEEVLVATGMADRREQLAGELSYGWQKTLTLAIGLAARPRLLLLDEPLTGISPTRVAAIAGLITNARESGTTICMIEHNVNLLMDLCDRIVALNFGRKMADGLPDEVTRDKTVIESYLGG